MDRTQRVAALVAAVQPVLEAALTEEWAVLSVGDLQRIEGCLQPILRRVGSTLLHGVAHWRLADLAGDRPVCPGCGGPLRAVGTRARALVGLVGDVTVRRPTYHCAACKAGVAPLDEAWGLGPGNLAPALARVACRDAIEAPFAAGADLLYEHLGVRLDPEQIRHVSEAVGALVEADQIDPTCWALPAADPVPAILVVQVDGVLVHTRTAWREVKVARVAPLGPALVRDQTSGECHLALGASTYAVGLEDADHFWPRVMREVVRAGWGRGVRVVVVIGDGAEWIWRVARTHLRRPDVAVVEILDFYHVSEHLAAVATAVFGAGSLRARAWLDAQCHALRHQGSTPVRHALAKLAPPDAAAADLRRKAGQYLRTHAARMQYPAFRTQLFPIGSGAIESTAKNLVQARQVLAGMRWTTAGAQHLANLRALHRSDRWPAFWQGQPQRRLRLLRPRQPWTRAATVQAATVPPATVPPAADPPPTPPALATPGAADPDDAPRPAPTTAPPPPRTRIATAGKPWAKGKDYWRRAPIAHPPAPMPHARSD